MKSPILALTATILMMVPISASAEATKRLTGSQLEKTVAGKTIQMQTGGVTLPIRYNPNKTMTGKLQAVAALLAPGTPARDQGKWWIDSDRLCQRWNRWLEGKTHCYKLKRDGQTVHWTRNDGRTGLAHITR